MWKIFSRIAHATRPAAIVGGRREYSADLPDGFGAKRITIQISLPRLPMQRVFSFTEHVTDEEGRPTERVIATGAGGWAISNDLGRSWKRIEVKGREKHHFHHAKWIGQSELLVQASAARGDGQGKPLIDLLVVSENGKVLAEHPNQGVRWHGCRAVDQARGTLMYAEYPRNKPVEGKRLASGRVFRSRDRGRSFEVVFERSGAEIRHFHFLQARREVPGEWWLTSGDAPHESHIWVSKDDGDTWSDVTAALPNHLQVDGTTYERDAFRLTDLAWFGDDVIWGSDDDLHSARPPGAAVFRAKADGAFAPAFVGRGRWHFRNIIDVGECFILLSQRSNQIGASAEALRPGVYLLHKRNGTFTHLFDLDTFPTDQRVAGFTFSRASRAAKDGTFFSYRSDEDVFDGGQKILEWKVLFE
jgi:hypothetical protein